MRYKVICSAVLVCVGGGFFATAADATTLSVYNPYVQLDNRGYNPFSTLSAGAYIRYGAAVVVPNGSYGTTGVATVTDPNTGATLFNKAINFFPSYASPNFFISRISSTSQNYAAGLAGNWALTFTNGTSQYISNTFSIPGRSSATQIPLINSVTISGTGSNPTFSWKPPANTNVDGYQILISDLSSPYQNKVVVKTQQTATSYTVPSALPNFSGNDHYIIQFRAVQTKDGAPLTSTSPGESDISAQSDAFFTFNQLPAGSPQVYLPQLDVNGSYQFNVPVVPDQTYYIDPAIATGYVYKTGAGDPNFASVLLPDLQGSTPYHILYSYLGTNYDVSWLGGQVYYFGGQNSNGVDQFTVTGIDPALMLDPNDSTAFITGLTFAGTGTFTGTQTPITSEVPEPSTLALFGASLGGLGLLVWEKKRKAAASVI